jgi:thiosulfate dehydrogenase [quinone] large subunit
MAVSIAVGAALILGTLTRVAAMAGIVLLGLFYLAHPPLHGMAASTMAGSYWIVNYNLIEIAALWVVMLFPTSKYFGLDVLIRSKKD